MNTETIQTIFFVILILAPFAILMFNLRSMSLKIKQLEAANRDLMIKSNKGKVLRVKTLPLGKRFKIAHALQTLKGTHVYLVLESRDKELWTTSRIVLFNIKREVVSVHPLRHDDVIEVKNMKEGKKTDPFVEVVALARPQATAPKKPEALPDSAEAGQPIAEKELTAAHES